jgi:hypothetical protein
MSISNIESSGFNSLFKSSEALMAKTVEANVPSQTERNLKSSNRSLSSENISLEGQNRLLSERNDELLKDNRNLTQDLKESQQKAESASSKNVETSRTEQMASAENSNQQPTRSEEKASSADDIDTTNYESTTAPTNTAQQVQAPTTNSYSTSDSSDLSGLAIGASFSSYA